jgi:hypothetical protein
VTTAQIAGSTVRTAPADSGLSIRRLNVMRFGYAFMGVGLAVVKWPLLLDLGSLPVMDGVVASILTAMSLLVFLGLRYPVKMLPILLFEVVWKLIWMAAVAVPYLASGTANARIDSVLFSCSFIIVVIAVIPWGFVWKQYAKAAGDPWR